MSVSVRNNGVLGALSNDLEREKMSKANSNNSYVQIEIENYYHYITLETWLLVVWWSNYVFNPAFSVLGCVGNVISFIVFRKCGLEQSSNILLFCLAIADMLCLLSNLTIDVINNTGIYKNRGMRVYLELLLIGIAERVVIFLSQVGFRASTYITVCIAIERLIAVFYPLHFNTLVTPKRVWLVGLSKFLMWIPWVLYFNATDIAIRYSVFNNNTILFENVMSNNLRTNIVYRTLRLSVFPNLTHTIPFIFVTIGSVVISLKIATALRKRQRLKSVSDIQKSSARTTKSMLLVCFVFSITHAAFFVTTIYETEVMDRWFTVFYTFLALRQTLVYANSSFNFVIYVAFNKKFSLILKSLFYSSTWCKKSAQVQTSKLASEKLGNK